MFHLHSFTPQAAEFLEAAVRARMSILVCGGPGTGKTNFINVLATFFEPGDRIMVIEDTRVSSICGVTMCSISRCVRDVRERAADYAAPFGRKCATDAVGAHPLAGEVRGGEAFDMLMANNTGHEGTITTVHANSATGAITRLLPLCALADEAQNFNPAYLAE